MENKSKLLSISVAAYNVQDYLEQCLSSLLLPDTSLLENLDVIVVDDGSNDETPTIARRFEQTYPNVFRLIRQENGGYGTTVNRALSAARGKYFKLVDGDDWVDTDGLAFVLKHLVDASEDWIETDTAVEQPDGQREVLVGGPTNLANRHLTVDEVGDSFDEVMWCMAFRTELLKSDPPNLPSHSLYTDKLLVAKALENARTCRYIDRIVYRYRKSFREGQSTSNVVRNKHWEEEVAVCQKVRESVLASDNPSAAQKKLLRQTHWNALGAIINLPASQLAKQAYRDFDLSLKAENESLWRFCGKGNRTLTAMRLTGYQAYWLRRLMGGARW